MILAFQACRLTKTTTSGNRFSQTHMASLLMIAGKKRLSRNLKIYSMKQHREPLGSATTKTLIEIFLKNSWPKRTKTFLSVRVSIDRSRWRLLRFYLKTRFIMTACNSNTRSKWLANQLRGKVVKTSKKSKRNYLKLIRRTSR